MRLRASSYSPASGCSSEWRSDGDHDRDWGSRDQVLWPLMPPVPPHLVDFPDSAPMPASACSGPWTGIFAPGYIRRSLLTPAVSSSDHRSRTHRGDTGNSPRRGARGLPCRVLRCDAADAGFASPSHQLNDLRDELWTRQS